VDHGTGTLPRATRRGGTNYANSLNWYFWINQSSNGNEGFLPTGEGTLHQGQGEVHAVLTGDLYGQSTRRRTCARYRDAGHRPGHHRARANNAPNTSRVSNIYRRTARSRATTWAVNGMALADFDGDGMKDLVVVTKSVGTYSGQILFLRNMGRTANPVFLFQSEYDLAADVPTSVAVADVDGDGNPDIVVGTQSPPATGHIQYWRNTTPSIFEFKQAAGVDAPVLLRRSQRSTWAAGRARTSR
jgi:hypothetical protein